ncbi:hypothetical protein HY622_02355 [Candidatus Uhrbacteria bacterium]|nr:hypothetical protein [Candidatus Uhrbacteria bacterium]
MPKLIQRIDKRIINRLQRVETPLARTAIFVVYFWFGFLKLIGVSPAIPLVQALFEKTIPIIPFAVFYTFFSVFEMIIGVLFLIRGFERAAIFLLSLHLIATALPLLFLPHITWQAFLIPTLEGQYIIKNILIAASAVVVGSKLIPMPLVR